MIMVLQISQILAFHLAYENKQKSIQENIYHDTHTKITLINTDVNNFSCIAMKEA